MNILLNDIKKEPSGSFFVKAFEVISEGFNSLIERIYSYILISNVPMNISTFTDYFVSICRTGKI